MNLRFSLFYRVLLGSFGAAVAWFASYPRDIEHFSGHNYLGQVVFPNAVAPIGAVLSLVCLLPASWIQRAVQRFIR